MNKRAIALCPRCGNKGLPGGCPSCKRDSNKIVLNTVKERKAFIKKTKYALIPENYVGKLWNRQVLIDCHPELCNDVDFLQQTKILEDFYVIIKDKGIVPRASLFFSAPSQSSKWIFAYSCMQAALTHNLKVAPLLDNIEVQRFLYFSGQKPEYKLYGWLTYEDYIQSDILFVSITKLDCHTYAYTSISDLIARRARLGKPTFVISKWKIQEIAQDSRDSDYSLMIDNTGAGDRLKYPNFISFGNDKVEKKRGGEFFG